MKPDERRKWAEQNMGTDLIDWRVICSNWLPHGQVRREINMPPVRQTNVTFKRAPRAKGRQGEQIGILLPEQGDCGPHLE